MASPRQLGVVLLQTLLVAAGAPPPPPEGATPMKFTVPNLSEEHMHSQVMPEDFVCDACRAVVYQLTLALGKVQPKALDVLRREQGKIAVQEHAAMVQEALENACAKKTFEEYGLKSINDAATSVLHGPGIENAGEGKPGVIQGGDKWPGRIAAICAELVEEKGEADLAARWRGEAGSLDELCDENCGKTKRPTRPKKQQKDDRKPKSSKASVPKQEKSLVTGLEELPPPPYSMAPLTRENMSTFLDLEKRKTKFRFVVFYDATPMSSSSLLVLELAARQLGKAKEALLRGVKFGRYDSGDGDMFGYSFNNLPRILFFRKGYKNPKVWDGGSLDGPAQVVDWLKNEVFNIYMKDDPDKFPRRETNVAKNSEL